MKKFTKILMVIALCFISVLGLAACNDIRITSGVVKSGTLVTTVVKGEKVDTSNVVVVLTYKDGSQKEVKAEDLAFSDVDTDTVGEKNLVINAIKYNYSFTVKIKVVATEADVNTILSMESLLLRDFNTNRQSTSEVEAFKDQSGKILVGQQNNFHFRLNVTGIGPDGELVENVQSVRTSVKVERLVDGSHVELTGDALTDYVAVNPIGAILKFTKNAIGEEFRITVKALNVQEGVEENQISFKTEVKVVDAFNVYTAKELSVYDNARENGDTDSFDWSAIKAEMGLTGVEVNGVVLQARINITKDDVPTTVFWTEDSDNFSAAAGLVGKDNLIGTPIDFGGRGIYKRKLADGKEFNFYGNYFTVDLKKFPKMVVERQGKEDNNPFVSTEKGKESMMTAHLCVFYNDKGVDALTKTTTYNWSNLGFYGNGGLSKNNEEVYTNSGGILLMKNYAVDFNAKNTVMNNFYIGYFFEKGDATNEFDGHFVVKDCRGFNSYQCLFYLWGAEDVKIIKSEFKHAGGPAIIADHCDPNKDGSGGYPTTIDIIESEIESKVTGKEPWFATYKATSIVQTLLQANQGLYPVEKQTLGKDMAVGKTADGVDQLNLVLIFKDGGMQGLSTSRIRGNATIYKTVAQYEAHKNGTATDTIYGLDLNANNGSHKSGANLIDIAINTGNVYFQDTISGNYGDGATATEVGKTNNPMAKGADTSVADAGTRLTAESEYVNVYLYLGMAAIFGLSK